MGREALAALARLDFATATPHLEAALSSSDPRLRYVAVAKLVEGAAASHTREILAALSDPDASVRDAADRALQTSALSATVEALIEALDRAPRSRVHLIPLISAHGANARAAIPALERLSQDPEVGGVARGAIERINASR